MAQDTCQLYYEPLSEIVIYYVIDMCITILLGVITPVITSDANTHGFWMSRHTTDATIFRTQIDDVFVACSCQSMNRVLPDVGGTLNMRVRSRPRPPAASCELRHVRFALSHHWIYDVLRMCISERSTPPDKRARVLSVARCWISPAECATRLIDKP